MDALSGISTLESAIGDPHQGLPEPIFLFASRIMPMVNVDLLIQEEAEDHTRRTLLTWRDDPYFGSGWHIPGGIIRYKEMAADRIRACALDELGAEVAFDAVPLLVSETVREPKDRGHFISLLYRCRLLTPPQPDQFGGPRDGMNPPIPGEWRWHASCPPDLLDVQAQYRRFF
jgi:colanic acid biosynthesis protein WcaH